MLIQSEASDDFQEGGAFLRPENHGGILYCNTLIDARAPVCWYYGEKA